jgi:hypothetical protein
VKLHSADSAVPLYKRDLPLQIRVLRAETYTKLGYAVLQSSHVAVFIYKAQSYTFF